MVARFARIHWVATDPSELLDPPSPKEYKMSTPSTLQRVHACGSTVFLSSTPVRMVHLIGGFTFGSLPQIFYQRLAERLCREKRYSVVLHPFRFTPFLPDHWGLALELYERLRTLQLRDLPLLSARDPLYLLRPSLPTGATRPCSPSFALKKCSGSST